MTKTVWVNGTERVIENKDQYGSYHVFLDEKDVRELNKKHLIENPPKESITSINKSAVRQCNDFHNWIAENYTDVWELFCEEYTKHVDKTKTDLDTARRCLNWQGFSCEHPCLNLSCPLNLEYKEKVEDDCFEGNSIVCDGSKKKIDERLVSLCPHCSVITNTIMDIEGVLVCGNCEKSKN